MALLCAAHAKGAVAASVDDELVEVGGWLVGWLVIRLVGWLSC